ncbi:hypothetical protein BVG16_15750 [Paenibacillus selenitireducens]|uniref:Terminase n=1 Tax=Paenibacillus selenitireducens TaxID=1324314 RepID=A0A1T2X9Q8_9BACL|nr:phage terminase small subunit [Paenibacillus selenitireducens]OPA76634.1 hypothetical protein BVG16_15750 [Paenibacillus selenitireducens]
MYKKAEADYQRGMKYKEIADKYGVSLNTVKSWKQRHGWERKKGAYTDKGVHTKKTGAPSGNKNAVGNKGGAAPKGNSNAVTHGFFKKYFPEETVLIMQDIEQRSPLDMLWDNIMIQYTAIVRAQRIMYVKDQTDTTTTKIEEKGGNVWGEKWEVQHAWDKHATFLQAQSRAMGELRSLIKQYEEMCRQGYEDEEQQLRIRKLKGDVAKIEKEVAGDKNNPIEIRITRKGDTS